MMRLAVELKKCNCTTTPDKFREVVETVFNHLFPDWTDDDLLCKPKVASQFDDEVRKRINCPAVPDEVINRTLINLRKSNQNSHKRTAAK